jgi:hypothetical protein
MRRLVLAAALVLGLPAAAAAAPCSVNTLDIYIGLGSTGCETGFGTVRDFSLDVFDTTPSPPLTPLLATQILVTPSGFSNGFQLDFISLPEQLGAQTATGGVFRDGVIGYTVLAPFITDARLSLSGASASPDGVVTGVEDICLNDVFGADPTDCPGTPVGPLLVLQDGFGTSELVMMATFAPTSFFDVFTEIAIDGGASGIATLQGAVSNQFISQVVPEPSTLLLLGVGLAGLARKLKSGKRRRP